MGPRVWGRRGLGRSTDVETPIEIAEEAQIVGERLPRFWIVHDGIVP
jgi:hypothetical protein